MSSIYESAPDEAEYHVEQYLTGLFADAFRVICRDISGITHLSIPRKNEVVEDINRTLDVIDPDGFAPRYRVYEGNIYVDGEEPSQNTHHDPFDENDR